MNLARVKRNRFVAFVLYVNRRYGEAGGNTSAAAIAYHGFLSLFPLMLLAASFLGFLLAGHPTLRGEVLSRISRSVPGFGTAIGDGLDGLVAGRAAAGAIGLVGLLWTATGIAESAGEALGRMFAAGKPESTIRAKARAISTTVGLGTLTAAGTVLAGFAAAASDPALRAFSLAAGLAVDFLLFMLAYRWLVPGPGLASRTLFPGAALAAVGWNTLKVAGGWYAARTIARSSAVYGTFASTVALLVLLTLSAKLFLYGAALNRTLADRAGGEETEAGSRAFHGRARAAGAARDVAI